jgi:hypothetical protein
MAAETPTPTQSTAAPHAHSPEVKPGDPSQPLLHRVCIQCNNMFCVTPDRFDAKQCPNCHKG